MKMMTPTTMFGIAEQMANPMEKRRFERFIAKDGAMLAFTSADDCYYTTIAKIADISKGGVAFESDFDEIHWGHRPCLEIFGVTGTYICVKKIPFEVVYIHPVATDDASIRKPKSFGLKFGELLAEQESQLDRFIKAYGVSI